jgi:hypothetical protein
MMHQTAGSASPRRLRLRYFVLSVVFFPYKPSISTGRACGVPLGVVAKEMEEKLGTPSHLGFAVFRQNCMRPRKSFDQEEVGPAAAPGAVLMEGAAADCRPIETA